MLKLLKKIFRTRYNFLITITPITLYPVLCISLSDDDDHLSPNNNDHSIAHNNTTGLAANSINPGKATKLMTLREKEKERERRENQGNAAEIRANGHYYTG